MNEMDTWAERNGGGGLESRSMSVHGALHRIVGNATSAHP